MHKRVGAAIAVMIAAAAWTPAAHAQDRAPDRGPVVELKIRVPDDLVRDVNRIVDSVTSGEVQRDIREALHDVTASLAAIDGREVRDAIRDAASGLAHARAAGWLDGQNRNFGASQVDRETKTYQLGPNGQLSLDNIVGDVTITAGSGRDVTVEIVRESRGRTDADARVGLDRVKVESSERSGRASVRAIYQPENHSNYSVSVRYVVTAPATTQISAHSVTGNMSATGIRGELSLVTLSGDVTVSHAGRLSEARTTSGDVKLTDVDSDSTLNATTTSGSITALQVKARRLDLGSISDDIIARDVTCENGQFHTISGEVEFSGPLAPRGRYQFTTHSGNVRIGTDGKVGFALEGSSFSGTIKSDFPIQTSGSRGPRRNLSGTFGDGSALIVATSFSGDVTLIKR